MNKPMAGDVISELSDDILCYIMSFLTTREAAATSCISRRWRHLWKKIPELELDAATFTGDTAAGAGVPGHRLRDFARWVDGVLGSRGGASLVSFRLKCPVGDEESGGGGDVDRWVERALAMKARKLDINLDGGESGRPRRRNTYVFPHSVLATVSHLSLSSCSLHLPGDLPCFDRLKSLVVKRTSLSESDVGGILTGCPSLEWLSIARCDCPPLLKLSGERCPRRLRHLNLYRCQSLKQIEIQGSVNLESFEFAGMELARVFVKNTGRLVRLRFGYVWEFLAGVTYALDGLARDFPQLETLLLPVTVFEKEEIPKQITQFTHLRRLVISIVGAPPTSLLELTSAFLSACPLLHTLELHLPNSFAGGGAAEGEASFQKYCRHGRLRKVGLYNFHGGRYEVEVGMYLLSAAAALQSVWVVIGESFDYRGDGEWCVMEQARMEDRIPASEVRRLFGHAMDPSTALVVRDSSFPSPGFPKI